MSFLPFLDVKKELPRRVSASPVSRSFSRISNMTVGDVRHCFAQMRARDELSASTVLWCGMTAGEFALQYLIHTTGIARKKKRPPLPITPCSAQGSGQCPT